MLALKDRHHFVRGTVRYLALASRMALDECQLALDKLSSPDPASRSQEHDGRRIRAEPGGWTILNGEKYNQKLSYEERKEYNRHKQAEYRKRKKDIAREGATDGAGQALTEGFQK